MRYKTVNAEIDVMLNALERLASYKASGGLWQKIGTNHY